MPTYFARKAGNINATDVWATTPSGTAGAVTFVAGDILVANSFTITVNVSTDLGGSGQVRNDTTGGATAGGSFTHSTNGVTLTANIFGGTNGSTNCVNSNPSTVSDIVYIVGNITGGQNTLAWGLNNSSGAGTINVTGNIMAGSASFNGTVGVNLSTATLLVTGNVTGGATGAVTQGEGIRISGASSCTVTGNVTGGGTSTAFGVRVTSTGNITVVGQAIGGVAAPAINNESTGQVTVTRAVGNGFGGGSVGLSAAVGVSNVANQSSITIVDAIEFGALGQSPVNGRIRLRKASSNVSVFNFCDTAGAKTLIDATTNAAMPAASNVRSGVSYASGALVGSCAVPAAGSVSLGVPVDNTTGTAVLTQADVQSALTAQGLTTARAGNLDNLDATVSSRLAPSGTLATVTNLTNAPASVTPADIWSHATRTITGGTVDTLTNAPSVPSASAIASQVRTELSVELGRVDAAISTRATPANIPTADIAAIKVKTDALNTTRLAQVSTTEIVGNLLAQANS